MSAFYGVKRKCEFTLLFGVTFTPFVGCLNFTSLFIKIYSHCIVLRNVLKLVFDELLREKVENTMVMFYHSLQQITT